MILVTGGLGYIGSHMAAILLANGHEVILVDNMSNSKMEILERLEFMAGRYVTFMRLDIRNTPAFQRVLEQYAVQAVVHCAGMKNIPDSVTQPLDFYNNNLTCTTSLLRAMQRSGIKTLVYSSSLAVYGADQADAVLETQAFKPATPYQKCMQMAEQIIQDVSDADSEWRVAVMRYGNVAGAYPTAVLGEWPSNVPNNLLPYVAQVARHDRDFVEVYGDQHATADGTGVRDYVHVMDAVEANMHALIWLFRQEGRTLEAFNIARGEAVSVKQVIAAFEKVTEQKIAHQVVNTREGDVSSLFGNVKKAKDLLKWEAKRSMEDIAQDLWRFYQTL